MVHQYTTDNTIEKYVCDGAETNGDQELQHQRHHIIEGQNRLSKSLADDSDSKLASAEVESTPTAGVGGPAVEYTLPFFFLPNVTPKLLAKLANVALAVVPVPVDDRAKGDVRGT